MKVITVALLLSLTSIVMAQNQPLVFEVATVKPSPRRSSDMSLPFVLCRGVDTRLPGVPPELQRGAVDVAP